MFSLKSKKKKKQNKNITAQNKKIKKNLKKA
jgi:hypothetical protein